MFIKTGVGCIYRPPLTCNANKDITGRELPTGAYNNKLSKLMETYYATMEQTQNQRMYNIDPHEEFHYKGTIQCKIDTKNRNEMNRANKCITTYTPSHIPTDVKPNQKTDQLLMEYGGGDLTSFVSSILQDSDMNRVIDRMFHFWHKVQVLLHGLKQMQSHGGDSLIHLDLKPENIVYNETTHKLAMIDFGIMETYHELSVLFSTNKYHYTNYFWNFSPELQFLNKDEFDRIQGMNDQEYDTYIKGIFGSYNVITNTTGILNYLIQTIRATPVTYKKYYIERLKYTLDYIHNKKPDFYYVISNIIPLIDVYGLGISLMYVFRSTSDYLLKHHAIDYDLGGFLDQIGQIFGHMTNPCVIKRISIDDAIRVYERILNTNTAYQRWLLSKPLLHPKPAQGTETPKTRSSPKGMKGRSETIEEDPSAYSQGRSKIVQGWDLRSPTEASRRNMGSRSKTPPSQGTEAPKTKSVPAPVSEPNIVSFIREPAVAPVFSKPKLGRKGKIHPTGGSRTCKRKKRTKCRTKTYRRRSF